jgi:SAM-dependent methyltransferase
MLKDRVRRWLRPVVPAQPKLTLRDSLKCYISGSGIEVGALHAPLDLSGLPVERLRYVDRVSVEELRRRYPELDNVALSAVDIVDDGERLGSFADESLDFIIGNHFIEHTRNPIGTILSWISKLKPGGVVFMAIPEMAHTFDRDRPLTSLQHLIEDSHLESDERTARDRDHFFEWSTFVEKIAQAELTARVEFLMGIDYSIHFHTFTLQSMLALLDHMRHDMRMPFHVKACADVVAGSNEFIVVLGRS